MIKVATKRLDERDSLHPPVAQVSVHEEGMYPNDDGSMGLVIRSGGPPTIIVFVAGDDAMRLEHVVELYEALRQGQLAIVPGASHLCFMEKPAVVNRLILDFLAADLPPQTMLPVRRRSAVSNPRAED